MQHHHLAAYLEGSSDRISSLNDAIADHRLKVVHRDHQVHEVIKVRKVRMGHPERMVHLVHLA